MEPFLNLFLVLSVSFKVSGSYNTFPYNWNLTDHRSCVFKMLGSLQFIFVWIMGHNFFQDCSSLYLSPAVDFVAFLPHLLDYSSKFKNQKLQNIVFTRLFLYKIPVLLKIRLDTKSQKTKLLFDYLDTISKQLKIDCLCWEKHALSVKLCKRFFEKDSSKRHLTCFLCCSAVLNFLILSKFLNRVAKYHQGWLFLPFI